MKRILIIDDEEDLVEMLALRLEATGGFSVVSKAFDGLTGLQRAKELVPDIVLLDNVMPGLDGWEVCRRLRADPSTGAINVVVMTAGSPSKAVERGREAQADRVVLKPYDHADLIEILKQLPDKTPGPEGANAKAS